MFKEWTCFFIYMYIECIGFYGINCGQPCQQGYYGEGCRSSCNCSAGQTCNQFVGCFPSGNNIQEICVTVVLIINFVLVSNLFYNWSYHQKIIRAVIIVIYSWYLVKFRFRFLTQCGTQSWDIPETFHLGSQSRELSVLSIVVDHYSLSPKIFVIN